MTPIAQEVEQLTNGRYSPRELRMLLARKRRKIIPDPTWARWKREFKIHPDKDGLYWQEDREILEGLITAIKAGWTINQYKQFLQEKQQNAERIWKNTGTGSNTTIEINSTVC